MPKIFISNINQLSKYIPDIFRHLWKVSTILSKKTGPEQKIQQLSTGIEIKRC